MRFFESGECSTVQNEREMGVFCAREKLLRRDLIDSILCIIFYTLAEI